MNNRSLFGSAVGVRKFCPELLVNRNEREKVLVILMVELLDTFSEVHPRNLLEPTERQLTNSMEQSPS
jgi:hypothetical protein